MAMAKAITVPRFTVSDLDNFPDDGNRYELLDGVLLVTPAPRAIHQHIVAELQFALQVQVRSPRLARVVGPGAISVPPSTQLQPDILVIPLRFSIDTDWRFIDEHWVAVEVLSRSSRVYDRDLKRGAYLALGVKEVWIVDISQRSIEVSRQSGKTETVSETLCWMVPDTNAEVTIDLADIFAGVP